MKMRVPGRDPFANIVALQDQVERLFRETRTRQRPSSLADTWQPLADIGESPEAYHLRFDLAGVAKADVRLGVQEGTLVLQGVKSPPELPGGRLVRRERTFGQFARSVPLPSDADDGDVTASFAQGVLEVRVGRRGGRGPRVIEIGG